MGFSKNTQATRSTLMSVDSTLSEAITASQDYIPIASTTNFSTSVVAEIETTNEVVSFTDISVKSDILLPRFNNQIGLKRWSYYHSRFNNCSRWNCQLQIVKHQYNMVAQICL